MSTSKQTPSTPDEAKPSRLGRGLSALLGETDFDVVTAPAGPGALPRELPVEFLRPNPFQPRKTFDDVYMAELSASIREKGVLQPLIVRPIEQSAEDTSASEPESFEIVAGERRWRAAQMASVHAVPVVIKTLTDGEALEIALVENIQRSDLNSIEEAAGYRALMDEFDHTQDHLGEIVGKSRSHIANMLRLLTLPEDIQNLISEGALTAGHGRACLRADHPKELADRIVKEQLNVRQAEALARGDEVVKPKSAPPSSPPLAKDADTVALENNVSNALGLKVTLHHLGDKGGEVRVAYKTLEQLDEICRRLSRDG